MFKRRRHETQGETERLGRLDRGENELSGFAAQGTWLARSGAPWWMLWLIWPVALAVKGLVALPLAATLIGFWQALATPALLVACGVLIGVGLTLIRRDIRGA